MTEWELGLLAFQRGRLHEAADRLAAAAQERERTVSLDVRFRTLSYLGAARYALGHADEAVAAFEEAVRFAPPPAPPADLRLNLANAYLAAGHRTQACETLHQTLRSAPGHVEARMLLRRLGEAGAGGAADGQLLGEHPESILRYIRSLSFRRVSSGGYDPAEVRLAFSQIEHGVEAISAQLESRVKRVAHLEALLERALQQTEEPD